MEIKKEYIKEYTSRITSLQSNIVNAYHLYYYLYEIENIIKPINHKKVPFFYAPFYDFQYTICYEFRQELILLIWKINIDCDKNANTLSHLKTDLENKFLVNTRRLIIPKNKIDPNLLNQIKNRRKQIIAHTDKEPIETFIDLHEAKKLLDNYLSFFNNLLFDNVIKNNEMINPTLISGKCKAGVEQFYTGIVYNELKENSDD